MVRNIRNAEQSDSDGIAGILRDAGVVQSADAQSRVEFCISHSPDTCLIAELDGNLSGALLSTFNGFHVFLSHIVVCKDARRAGLATALHCELVMRARAVHAIGIIADSWLTATPLFYRLGYRIPGAVFMINDLD